MTESEQKNATYRFFVWGILTECQGKAKLQERTDCGTCRNQSSFLAAIESGRRKPSLDVLIRLVNAIGASFDEILAPQMITDSEIVDRIRRLVPQCSQRDQELLLALIDKMLDTKEKKDNK